MKHQVFKFLKQCSSEPHVVDSLIVSAFISMNELNVEHNILLKSLNVREQSEIQYRTVQKLIEVLQKEISEFGFEELIELFEFVISPADKIVNGAVYTPSYIREYIVNRTLTSDKTRVGRLRIADIACGCGGFLFNASRKLKKKTEKSYASIFKDQIFGLDIQPYSITRTKVLLSLLALSEGEDAEEFEFNLVVADALTFEWKNVLKEFDGFDLILGNPPYVCSKHISAETKINVAKWEVSKSGHPDLYIPFFQIGIENLCADGVLGFITMNSFFKSLNGRALREYFKTKRLGFEITDFGAEQVFKSKNTYTCLCIIKSRLSKFIRYSKNSSDKLPPPSKSFSKIHYASLDSMKGWNLRDNEIITKIESTGTSFGEIYNTRHGIATLRNDVYIFRPIGEDEKYYYLQNGKSFRIEKGICKDIVNSNKLSRPSSLKELKEKVVFPYDDGERPKILDEAVFRSTYPKAYEYLDSRREILSLRDKGKGEYEAWFAFGRTQSLEKIKNKLFFPKYSDRNPSCLVSLDGDLLFYNGLAIVGHSEAELIIIKKILESRLFWYYIKTTSKPYSSNYYSLNGNYIRNFGIVDLDDSEKEFVTEQQDKTTLDKFFETKYDIEINI
jgi:adenine-specific DNA-methyltransferase